MDRKKDISICDWSTKHRSLALLCAVCLVLSSSFIRVQTLCAQSPDSLRIGVITCAPGDDMYTLFGHTAIRVRELVTVDSSQTHYDVVGDWIFNYGAFNFKSDRFVYRFVKGETDYVLAAEPSGIFFKDLIADNRKTTEQVLNLTASEKKRLFDYLKFNIRPENRVYRYNWLYYNCTNRAKEVIEQAVEGRVEYRKDSVTRSARNILHSYTKVNSWYAFGIDMILGTEIDGPLTHNQQMFIPQIYQDELDSAVIVSEDGSVRPLVAQVLYPVYGREYGTKDVCDFPLFVMIALFALVVATSVWEWRNRRCLVALDVTLCSLIGLAGCVVAFLFFFSVHPGTSTDWLVVMLNPIPLLFIPLIIKRKGTRWIVLISLMVILTQIAVLISVRQNVDNAMIALVLSLLVRIVCKTYMEFAVNKNKR